VTSIIDKISRRCNYYSSRDQDTANAISEAFQIVRAGELSKFVVNRRGSAAGKIFADMSSITPGAEELKNEDMIGGGGLMRQTTQVMNQPMFSQINISQKSALDQFKQNLPQNGVIKLADGKIAAKKNDGG